MHFSGPILTRADSPLTRYAQVWLQFTFAYNEMGYSRNSNDWGMIFPLVFIPSIGQTTTESNYIPRIAY